MRAQMNQADSGDDLMRPALQACQHAPRVSNIGRFPHDFVTEKDQCVGAEHERVGDFFCHQARLAVRVELAEFPRRQMFMRHFRRVAGDDLKTHVQLPQQFRPARRC